MLSHVTIFCFFASYVVALATEVVRIYKPSTIARGVAVLFASAGLLAHTLYLFEQSRQAHLPPLLSSTQDWLLVLAWVTSGCYLVLAAIDGKPAIGVFLLPAVLLLIGAATLVTDHTNSTIYDSEVRSLIVRRWALLHAGLILFGIAAVLMGTISSLMYLYQHRRLKHAASGGFDTFSLERLANWNRMMVLIALPMLTLGLGAGYILGVFTRTGEGDRSFWDPMVVISSIAWLILGGLLTWTLRSDSQSSRTVILRTLLAFSFLLLTLIGLQIVTGGHAS
ncbi:cytochrome c biogenesis protein CcsA [Calycomorphotria hydatis]|uniref:Cytochrome c biogenesis protein CcsA n=1 Tax=Calycomorphotria hydatis TaxID=2528027 RepID=A0A517T9E6_9PLAN|nr:cytochrome c biogenesis protein CcsA [Calycomorphotria hydatis]QDT64986.1 Cytochrome c biogenesis protein CcsA [Calycomorphotria hydatis]